MAKASQPPDLGGLDLPDVEMAIVRWFQDNYEDDFAVHDEEYPFINDIHGSFDALDVLKEVFGVVAPREAVEGARGFLMDLYVPNRSRAIPVRSADEAHADMQAQIHELQGRLAIVEEALAKRRHNGPPEQLDDDEALDQAERRELRTALQVLQSQPLEPSDDKTEAKEAAVVVETIGRKIRTWLASQTEAAATATIKTVASEAAKYIWREHGPRILSAIVALMVAFSNWFGGIWPF